MGFTHEPEFELHVVGHKLDRTTGTDRMSICARAHMLLRSNFATPTVAKRGAVAFGPTQVETHAKTSGGASCTKDCECGARANNGPATGVAF